MQSRSAPVEPRARWTRRALCWLEPAVVLLAILGLWELVARRGGLDSATLPPPTSIAAALEEDVRAGGVLRDAWISIKAWAAGLALVAVIAPTIGVAIGLSRLAYSATHLTIEFVRTIPSIAAIPFLVLLYGVTFKLTVVLIVLTALWPLLIQTMYGVQDVDPVARETARAYGLGWYRRLTRITLPTAAPYIATGLRLSGVIAMIVAIAASLIVGGQGLGAAIADAERGGLIPLMYGRIFLTGLLGLAVTIALTALERRMLHWHPSQRLSSLT